MTGAEALMQKGRLEMGRDLLLRQLSIKFEPLEKSVESKVKALSEKRLESLAERVMTANTLAALEL
jgi:hypothetical protein